MSRKRGDRSSEAGQSRGCLRWVVIILGMACGAVFLLAFMMTIFEDREVATPASETPGAVDRRMTEAFADIPTEGAGTVTRTPVPTFDATVQFGALTATAAARVTATAVVFRPSNCEQAVAMGLTAQEAAEWSHLDRDGDGVACYGD